jgi:hypothetical protein
LNFFNHVKQFETKINYFGDQNHRQQNSFLFLFIPESNEILSPLQNKKLENKKNKA